MGYIKAEEILPKELIEEIQNHIEGKSIYIPKKEGSRQGWGTGTLTRRELEERNRAIFEEFSAGSKVCELAAKYCLSEKSIQRILRERKEDMKEEQVIYAYHVVTDKPMQLGQHILFDEEHHSGVYERVMSKKELVKDFYEHPEKYDIETLDYPLSVAIREFALEEVRENKYPGYPSRMNCLYTSRTQEESGQWFDYFTSLGRPTYQIIKVKVKGRCFVGDATKCFDAALDKEENLKQAERYWENKENPPGERGIVEMLVDGDIEVVEIIKEVVLDQ